LGGGGGGGVWGVGGGVGFLGGGGFGLLGVLCVGGGWLVLLFFGVFWGESLSNKKTRNRESKSTREAINKGTKLV